MINDKKKLTVEILKRDPSTRSNSGNFLNSLKEELYPLGGDIDFNDLKVESWTRAWRKCLEERPYLDERDDMNREAELVVIEEMKM